MNTPHMPGDRFFARLRSFDCECPSCGTVYLVRARAHQTRRSRTGRIIGSKAVKTPKVVDRLWDDVLQRLYCYVCDRSFALGLVAWPVRPGGRLRPAEDSIPTPRQANAIRQQSGGFFPRTRKGSNDPRNVIVTESCTCAPDSRFSNPSCPVHGSERGNLPATPPKHEPGSLPAYRKPGSDYDEQE